VSDLSRKTFSILGSELFCPKQITVKSENVRIIISLFIDVCSLFLLSRQPSLPLTVSGLAKVAIFTTNVDAENQTLINHKSVCGALKRHFCQAFM
jgi:hypothetical protein